MPPAVEAETPNHWTTRESLEEFRFTLGGTWMSTEGAQLDS